jgi:hypothetical protein
MYRIILYGKNFKPDMFEAETKLAIKYDIIGKRGRYKDKKIPFGHASLEAPADLQPNDKIDWLLSTIENVDLNFDLKSFLIEDISLALAIGYEDQFNFELDSKTINKLAKLNIDFRISAYQL